MEQALRVYEVGLHTEKSKESILQFCALDHFIEKLSLREKSDKKKRKLFDKFVWNMK